MKRPALAAAAALVGLALVLGGCKEKKTKAELYAEREQYIVDKMEKLRERQQQITTRLAELEERLVIVRRRKEELQRRWSEPTPSARPTRRPTPA